MNFFFLIFPLTENERECQNSETYSNDDKGGPSLQHQFKVLRNTQGLWKCCPITPKSQIVFMCLLFINKQTTHTLETCQLSSEDANWALLSPLFYFCMWNWKIKWILKMPTANLQWIQYTETSPVSGLYKDAANVATTLQKILWKVSGDQRQVKCCK